MGREVFYRGFDLRIDAVPSQGAVWVLAQLRGGPEHVNRTLRFMSTRGDPEAACVDAESELLQVVDDLLQERGYMLT